MGSNKNQITQKKMNTQKSILVIMLIACSMNLAFAYEPSNSGKGNWGKLIKFFELNENKVPKTKQLKKDLYLLYQTSKNKYKFLTKSGLMEIDVDKLEDELENNQGNKKLERKIEMKNKRINKIEKIADIMEQRRSDAEERLFPILEKFGLEDKIEEYVEIHDEFFENQMNKTLDAAKQKSGAHSRLLLSIHN